MQFRTLACLAVLSGAWKHRGGGLARSTHALQFAALDMDRVLMPEVYKPGVRVLNMRDLGNDLCNRDLQPPIRSLMVYGANPMVSMPNQGRIREGLLREDLFTVVHDLFVTDTALYADYVLPATSQIEHLDLSPAWGHLYLALNRPAIAPRGESVSNTELFRRLARALGRTEPWLFESDESMLRGGAGERPSVARRDHVRAAVGRGLRAVELPGGLAAVCERRLRDAIGQGGALLGAAPRAGARSAAVGGRDPRRRRSAADHRQVAALPELRLQQHGAAIAAAPASCSSRSTPTTRGRGAWRPAIAVRVWNDRGEVRAVCSVSDRVRPGVAWMPFGGFIGCERRAAIGQRAHARGADRLGRRQRPLRRVRRGGAGRATPTA